MAVTITTKGSDLKVDKGTEINYYPIDDIRQRVIGTKVELYLEGSIQPIESFDESEFVSPSGTAQQISDAISVLSTIITQDFLIEVGKGNIENHSIAVLSGRNISVSTSLVDIEMSGSSFTWPTVAATLEAISDDIADDAAGAGARKIIVKGLDANFDLIEEEITMNGTSPSVATTAVFIRVNDVEVTETGTYGSTSGGSNTGNITVRISGGGATLGFISNDLLGNGVDTDGKYTVPNGHIAIVVGVGLNVTSNKEAKLLFQVRAGADIVSAPFTNRRIASVIDGGSGRHSIPKEELNSIIQGKTDIWSSSVATAVNTEVSVRAVLLLIKLV